MASIRHTHGAFRSALRVLFSKLGFGVLAGGVLLWWIRSAMGFFGTDPRNPVFKTLGTVSIVLGVLLLAGVVVLVQRWLRRPRPVERQTGTPFVGPIPVHDKNRFFGRELETEEILRRLLEPGLRMFTLTGESGTGKTSLIRAALIPRLEAEQGDRARLPIYVRLHPDPELRLREAIDRQLDGLGAGGPPRTGLLGPDGQPLPHDRSAEPLRQRAQRLRAAAGRPLVFFFDQFEEWFVRKASVDPDQHRAVRAFIQECLGDAGAGITLVFALRMDTFAKVHVFDDFVDDVFHESKHYILRPFDRATTRRVIEQLLDSANPKATSPRWEQGLIDAVLDDLVKSRRWAPGHQHAIVLPAELQIVCQTLYQRGSLRAAEYPGKHALMREYVRRAINESGEPKRTLELLTLLVEEGGATRRPARTAAEIARHTKLFSEAEARSTLARIEQDYRLVTRLESVDLQTGEPLFELAHDHLAPIVRELSGHALDRAMQARQLVREWRRRPLEGQARPISAHDARWILKYAQEDLSETERAAAQRLVTLRRRRTALLIVVPLALWAVTRFCLAHVVLQYQKSIGEVVVVRRGIPLLVPILGSRETLVDTGIEARDLSPDDAALCRRGRVLPHIPGVWEEAVTHELEAWAVYGLQQGLATNPMEYARRNYQPHASQSQSILDCCMRVERVREQIIRGVSDGEFIWRGWAGNIVLTDGPDFADARRLLAIRFGRTQEETIDALLERGAGREVFAEFLDGITEDKSSTQRALAAGLRARLALPGATDLQSLEAIAEADMLNKDVLIQKVLDALLEHRPLTAGEIGLASRTLEPGQLARYARRSAAQHGANHAWLPVLANHIGGSERGTFRTLLLAWSAQSGPGPSLRASLAEYGQEDNVNSRLRGFIDRDIQSTTRLAECGLLPEETASALVAGLGSYQTEDILEALGKMGHIPAVREGVLKFARTSVEDDELAALARCLEALDLERDEALPRLTAEDLRAAERVAVAYAVRGTRPEALLRELTALGRGVYDTDETDEALQLLIDLDVLDQPTLAWARPLVLAEISPFFDERGYVITAEGNRGYFLRQLRRLAAVDGIDDENLTEILDMASDARVAWIRHRLIDTLAAALLHQAESRGEPAEWLVELLESAGQRSSIVRAAVYEALARHAFADDSGHRDAAVRALLAPLDDHAWLHYRESSARYSRALRLLAG